ncbi:MAG: DUF2461 domain-containing protein [Bacteroidia bacterium]
MDFDKLIRFLTELKENNHKPWFDTNRQTYDDLRNQWIEFTEKLIHEIGKFDEGIALLEPKNCIFRINKDVRFSKDKLPYKTNFGINLNPGGKKAEFMGYYFHVEPNSIFFAAGSYMPMPATLAAIRQEIDYNADELLKIINAKTFKQYFGKLEGDKLTRPPKGYDDSNGMIEYIKLKHIIAVRNFKPEELKKSDIIKEFGKTAKAAKPLLNFLRRAIE